MLDVLKKTFIAMLCGVALAACSSAPEMPRVVQASPNMPEVRLISGMATQIEMPASGRVTSVTTGNPALVTAERGDGIVNLLPKEGSGETNLIIRSINEEGQTSVYQYRLIVEPK